MHTKSTAILQFIVGHSGFALISYLDKNRCLIYFTSMNISSNTTVQTFQYTLTGGKWAGSSPVITWSFAGNQGFDTTLGVSYSGYPQFEDNFSDTQKNLIRKAFQVWENVADIDLKETDDSTAVNIRIGWDSIDGSSSIYGTTLGQATVWTASDRITKASIQIDLADLPSADFSTNSPDSGKWSFLGTVTHEIGHTLGLGHAASSKALMYAQATGVVAPVDDDINAITALYGQTQALTVSQNPKDLPSLEKGIDPEMYLAANTDVAAADIDPVVHFNTYGWTEGRNPNYFFDVEFYFGTNPDVNDAGINPLSHYLEFGWTEGRNPSDSFSTSAYLTANPDVQLAGINPLVHYLVHGFVEGRSLA